MEINGIYTSSTSEEKLRPLITIGEITRIVENTNNPYLLDNGKIGWVNDNVIKNKLNEPRYLENKTYQGNSLADELKEINIDSSYQYRSKLAKINNINNYSGIATPNIQMLELLKKAY